MPEADEKLLRERFRHNIEKWMRGRLCLVRLGRGGGTRAEGDEPMGGAGGSEDARGANEPRAASSAEEGEEMKRSEDSKEEASSSGARKDEPMEQDKGGEE